jgi:DNA repair protein RecN (Recombination protein N)
VKQQENETSQYNTFLLKELTEAKLKTGEQEELEREYEQINNVEIIKRLLINRLLLQLTSK